MPVSSRPIIYVTPYYPPYGAGGAEYTASLHAQLLVEKGHKVIVVTPNYGAEAEFTIASGVDVMRYPFNKLKKIGDQVGGAKLYSRRHQTELARFLYEKFVGMDIACIHVQQSFSLIGASDAAQKLNVPLIVHIRDTSLVCALGATCLVKSGASKVPSFCGLKVHLSCSSKYGERFRQLGLRRIASPRVLVPYVNFMRLRSALDKADKVVFASKGLLNLYSGLRGLPDREKLRVVYAPAVSVNVSQKSELPPKAVIELVESGIPYILYVGKVSKGKGLDVLFDAHRKVLERIPNVRLVVAGNHHQGQWSDVENRTLFLGFVEREQLSFLYKNCAVVAVPSTWPEPLGWGTLDAGRHARPIVATNVGGIPEAVVDGETGYLVPPLQPLKMARAFEKIISNDALNQEMARKNRKFILSKFGPKAVLKQLNAVYSDC
jgi:glycosyltransferase involved in cell wall biosynthesis